jgi:hypothetical protein
MAMTITRSDLFVFCAGVAVGAVAIATYPKWKEKLGPLLDGVMDGAGAAFAKAGSPFDMTLDETAGAEGEATAATIRPAPTSNATAGASAQFAA